MEEVTGVDGGSGKIVADGIEQGFVPPTSDRVLGAQDSDHTQKQTGSYQLFHTSTFSREVLIILGTKGKEKIDCQRCGQLSLTSHLI